MGYALPRDSTVVMFLNIQITFYCDWSPEDFETCNEFWLWAQRCKDVRIYATNEYLRAKVENLEGQTGGMISALSKDKKSDKVLLPSVHIYLWLISEGPIQPFSL